LGALQAPPAGVFVNGDCAYLKGERADYAALVGLLSPVRAGGMPIHLLLGNHDDRDHFRKSVRQVASVDTAVRDRHVALVRSPRANWYLLDSLDQVNVTPGLLGEAQLAWLAKALDANRDRPAIVVGHHNLEQGEVKTGLKDGRKLLEVMEPRRHVKAYIYGHTHRWQREQTERGLHVINLPPVAYPFEAPRPSGWVDARLEAEGIRLELRCVDPGHQLQGEVVELKWRAG
jgi:3',5'-cyclic AMP phosphodiesterase CpdA